MDLQQLFALLAFATVLYGTPGPATLSLAASGAAYGFRQSLPYLLGIIVGLLLNLLIAAFGLGYLFTQYPAVHDIFKYASLLYVLYLAYKIARSSNLQLKDTQPLGFFQGVLLNVLNPKAYAAAIATITQFTSPDDGYLQSVTLVIVFIMIVGIIVDFGWCYVGQLISKVFSSTQATSRLNITLALVLVVSVLIATFAV